MSDLITVEHVDKEYQSKGIFGKGSAAKILRNVDFSIPEGTTVGLVGESGSGKTTTTRMILRQEKVTSGRVLYRGRDLAEFTKDEVREYQKEAQIVFQNPYSSLDPTMKIGESIAEPLVISGCGRKEIQKKMRKTMEAVGLAEDYLDRFPSEFSGGQRQRIAIARALIGNPRLLILDEPVSALDVSIRGQILNLLKQLQQAEHTTYLFISHDMSSVAFLSDQIAVMYFGSIVEFGSTQDIMEDPRHPYTAMLIHSNFATDLGDLDEEDVLAEPPSHMNPPKGCPFADRCPYAEEICRQKRPEKETLSPGHTASCHRIHEIGKPEEGKEKPVYHRPEYHI